VHDEIVEAAPADTQDAVNRDGSAECIPPVSARRGEYARGMDVPEHDGSGLCDCDLLGRKCTCADQERLPPQEKNGDLYYKVSNTVEDHYCAVYTLIGCIPPGRIVVAHVMSHETAKMLCRYTRLWTTAACQVEATGSSIWFTGSHTLLRLTRGFLWHI
jgi:hypothetical protein